MKKKILLVGILPLMLLSYLFAQDDSSQLFMTMSGELPSYDLNHSNILAQQYNLGFGYKLPKDVELFLNIGNGLFGIQSDDLNFVCDNTTCGVGFSYLYRINTVFKLGLECQVAYGFADVVNNVDYSNAICQAGIKAQSANSDYGIIDVYGVLGVRQRNFFDFSTYNSWELYYTIGMRFAFWTKEK